MKLISILIIVFACIYADAQNSTFIQGSTLIESVSVIVSSAGTTTLTSSSNTNQQVTGSTTQTLKLPDATTLSLGRVFSIVNQSSGAVAVQDGSAGALLSISGGDGARVVLTNKSTAAGVWSQEKVGSPGSGAVTSVTTSSPILSSGGATPNISIPVATSSVNGYLSSTDWSTFNSKEPAISSGTTLQYWRGDKSFQTLNTSVVPEGSNLYFTNARAQGSVSATSPLVDTAGVFSIPVATSSVNGYLSSADWSTFNSKEPAQTKGSISTATTGVSVGSGANSTVGPNVTVNVQTASGSQPGLLSAADWTTFNNKASSFTINHTVYVSLAGNDSTCLAERIDFPCLTLTGAESKTSASLGNNWAISVAPGQYTEASFNLLPYVFIVGELPRETNFFAPNPALAVGAVVTFSGAFTLDATWNSSTTPEGGFVDIFMALSNAQVVDLSAATSALFYVQDCLWDNSAATTFQSNPVSTSLSIFLLNNSDFTAGGNITNMDGQFFYSNSKVLPILIFNADTVNSNAVTFSFLVQTAMFQELHLNGNVANSSFVQVACYSCLNSQEVFVDGANAFYGATLDGFRNSSNVVITNGGMINRVSDAFGLGYFPAVPGNWSPAPNNVSQALDILAAAGGGGGANFTLSNLTSPTAINQDLIFGVTAGVHLVKTGDTSGVNSDALTIETGDTDNNISGALNVRTGQGTTNGGSGVATFGSGDAASNSSGTGDTVITTGANGNSANFPSGNSIITTGITTTQNSGDVVLSPGIPTGAGTRGKIAFTDGTEGTSGYCWTSTDTLGHGSWQACGVGGGANTALSNLASTAVNADINPASTGTVQLGNNSANWMGLYTFNITATDNPLNLKTQEVADATGHDINIKPGTPPGPSDDNGGNVNISGADPFGAGQAGKVILGSDTIPLLNAAYQMGSFTNEFSNVYTQNVYAVDAPMNISTARSTDGVGADISIFPGTPPGPSADNGGSLNLSAGAPFGAGIAGNINLETSALGGVGQIRLVDGHIVSALSSTSAPTVAVQPAAGTGATCTIASATDDTGQITIDTGTIGISTGSYCQLTFNHAHTNAPNCILGSVSGTLSTVPQSPSTTTTMNVNFGVAIGAASIFVLNYWCIETQ
jgi:hypothetical protein